MIQLAASTNRLLFTVQDGLLLLSHPSMAADTAYMNLTALIAYR